MSGLTYDAGALLAGEANRRDLWALHAQALQRGHRPTVPSAVLAQAWRGGPQALLSRLLRGCRIEILTDERARSAGGACARSRSSDVVDASVVVGAVARDDVIVTSDAADLLRIAVGLRRSIRVHRI